LAARKIKRLLGGNDDGGGGKCKGRAIQGSLDSREGKKKKKQFATPRHYKGTRPELTAWSLNLGEVPKNFKKDSWLVKPGRASQK